MSISVDGKEIPTTETGFLENVEDWSESVARVLADQEKLELSERHWDLVNYLRDEYVNNAGNQPNTRALVKAMAGTWGDKSVNAKTLGRIAGLPESRRKGGY
jgi:tRNA 2-thiouridine synthesizing protein E